MKFSGGFVGAAVQAAADPERPVEMVVAGSPGGVLDLVARALAAALREARRFGGSFVIRKLGGAGGNLARADVYQRQGDPQFV